MLTPSQRDVAAGLRLAVRAAKALEARGHCSDSDARRTRIPRREPTDLLDVILHRKCRVDNPSNGGLDVGTGPSSSRLLVEKWAARKDESSGKDGFSVDAKPIAQVADELGMTTGRLGTGVVKEKAAP